MEKHLAIYGSVKIPRMYCNQCKGMTLVVDGIKKCCDEEAEINLKKIVKMSGGENHKSMPGLKIQKKILEVQNNKCLYCEKQFGDLYMKNGKVRQLKIQWDHLIPYSYSKENKFNFVAACNICNQIKSNKIFNTVEEVFHYVRYHREKKGIQYI